MSLVAFMQASNVSWFQGSWLYPSGDPDYLSVDYYRRVVEVLEAGRFDMVFFDDRLAMPGVFGHAVDETVLTGARSVKLDLSVVLGALAPFTRHIGLGATCSTTFSSPYSLARMFSTLDHLSGGRAAWNIVTSLNDSEAENFGLSEHVEHDERYAIAEEFVELASQLWASWDEDAVVQDRATRMFADPAKVREVNFKGKYFSSRGPLTVPRSPQGRPVLIQAGQSPKGRDFAARTADVIFINAHTIDQAKEQYADQKRRIKDAGRDPDQVKILPVTYAVCGETETIAKEKVALMNSLVDPRAALVLLSDALNFDFSGMDIDAPLPDDMGDRVTGSKGLFEALKKSVAAAHGPDRAPRLSDLIERRASLAAAPCFVGDGNQIADQMEQWVQEGACDGFVIAATHIPGTFEEFVRLVVPTLRERGLVDREYGTGTLRDSMGLAPA
ncbi:LLM class flavin-dependent oxidoreductase [Nocardia sp. NPDC059239]